MIVLLDNSNLDINNGNYCRVFVPLVVSHIYKCKQISEIGAEQLLLDIAAMKGIIVEMPALTNVRGAAPKVVPGRYTKYVNKEISKAEKILKVILSSPSVLDLTFVQVLPKGTEQLFVRLLDIKVRDIYIYI